MSDEAGPPARRVRSRPQPDGPEPETVRVNAGRRSSGLAELSPSRFMTLAAMVMVLFVALGFGLARLVGDDTEPSASASSRSTTTAPVSTTAAPSTSFGGTADEARGVVAGLVAEQAGAVAALDGTWVAILSTKKVGMVLDGDTIDEADVLRDYQELALAHPGALLLATEGYHFRTVPGWATIWSSSFDTPEAANAWCDAQGIAVDDCFALLLQSGSGVPETRSRT